MKKSVTLDTHTLIWSLFKPSFLGKEATRLIQTVDRVLVSSISLAEIEIKAVAGKLTIPKISQDLLSASRFELVAFGATAANQISRFSGLKGHDPFDRMLLAQASALDSYFITSDSVLLNQNLDFVLDAEA